MSAKLKLSQAPDKVHGRVSTTLTEYSEEPNKSDIPCWLSARRGGYICKIIIVPTESIPRLVRYMIFFSRNSDERTNSTTVAAMSASNKYGIPIEYRVIDRSSDLNPKIKRRIADVKNRTPFTTAR
jgi:hypothetical protein